MVAYFTAVFPLALHWAEGLGHQVSYKPILFMPAAGLLVGGGLAALVDMPVEYAHAFALSLVSGLFVGSVVAAATKGMDPVATSASALGTTAGMLLLGLLAVRTDAPPAPAALQITPMPVAFSIEGPTGRTLAVGAGASGRF
jgi:hypothetical protein